MYLLLPEKKYWQKQTAVGAAAGMMSVENLLQNKPCRAQLAEMVAYLKR